ncbi:MAG: diaminopimelate decarboxylase, partial [Sporomusaceae bacterium]|nr:diaminopimelate decarboxylase [Sporomusaceae bacterium]
MTEKTLPFTQAQLEQITKKYPTPFHLYDEKQIRENIRSLFRAFAWADGFKEHFAVKANPNPYILKILREEGAGADCSSLAELVLADKAGVSGCDIILTSNNTPLEEFQKAKELGAVINLDDISHIEYLEKNLGLPEKISLRYNPGPSRSGGNAIIGKPEEAKYGFTKDQIFTAYQMLQQKGVKKFGLHTMVVSNELDINYLVGTANMLFDLVAEIYQKTNVKINFINLG